MQPISMGTLCYDYLTVLQYNFNLIQITCAMLIVNSMSPFFILFYNLFPDMIRNFHNSSALSSSYSSILINIPKLLIYSILFSNPYNTIYPLMIDKATFAGTLLPFLFAFHCQGPQYYASTKTK